LVKTLVHEWPGVFLRVVDLPLDKTLAPAELADLIMAELGDREGPVEVGYTESEMGTQRITLQCVPAPLDLEVDGDAGLDAESVVMVTGGARGITAAIAQRLAERYQPTLILVGRSRLPEPEEAADTADLTDPAQIKGALIARLKDQGQTVTPQVVEAAYHRLVTDREIRANMAALAETGARIHYRSADVRDEAAFGGLIDQLYQEFGRIDGVIHGAGIIQDKLIRDKTQEVFDRVFGTKVDSALILSRRLRPDSLKFCVFFGSVAGRFGNRGQSDYAAANEVMAKLAALLDRRWPARVVTIDWGPWSSIGMGAKVEAVFGERGVVLIPPVVGQDFFDQELCGGRKGQTEVVIAGDVGQLALRGQAIADSSAQTVGVTS
jgi:NAD(P)-dependent dehydrogenase (short-subunit alcohol dehydrogenase family)